MKVILDCDNTMGVKGCDVDDGLALLYLLGKGNVEICGITTTYGNSDVDTVYNNTLTMLKEIGRTDIPVLKGCPNRYIHESEAADFILETVSANPSSISILATGSLTNLIAAYIKDQTLFQKVSEVVVMGGITEKLIINNKSLDELNFSCDPSAAQLLLKEAKNLSIITGNNCLKAFFSYSDFINRLTESNTSSAAYILNKCGYWFNNMNSLFGVNGFYNWDVTAAVYLINSKLFKNDHRFISLDRRNLETGLLECTPGKETSALVNLPVPKDESAFIDEIYKAWFEVKIYEKIKS